MLVGEVFVRIGLSSTQFEQQLNNLEGKIKKKAGTLGTIFKNAFSVSLGIALWETTKKIVAEIAKVGIDFNSQMEQAKIGFTTMLGSAQKAKVFLENLREFAVKTPFEFTGLLDAAKRMLAYGFSAKEVLPTLKAVGDASAALGLNAEGIDRIILALGQIRAKGKLSAEEMMQLTEAGIPAWDMLAEATGKTTAEIMKMTTKGLIPANKAIEIIVKGMGERFGGMMQQMENSWQGVTSALKDIWQSTVGILTKTLFQGVLTWLQNVRDFASGFYETLRQYGLDAALTQYFGPEIAGLVNMIAIVLKGFWTVITGIANTIRSNWSIIKPIVYSVLIGFISFKMATVILNATRAATNLFTAATLAMKGALQEGPALFQLISRAVGIYRVQLNLAALEGIKVTGVIQKMKVAMYSLNAAIGPIGWITIALSLLVTAGIWVYQNWEKVKHYGLQAWGALKTGIGYAVYGIISMFKFLLGWIPGIGAALAKAQQSVLSFVSKEKSIMASRKATYANANKPIKEMAKAVNDLSKIANSGAAALNNQANAANNAGKAAKKAGKDTKKAGKEAQGGLMGFDEINQLMKQTADAAGDAAGGIGNVGDVSVDLGDVGDIGNIGGIGDIGGNDLLSDMDGLSGEIDKKNKSLWSKIWDGTKKAFAFGWDAIKLILTTTWDGICGLGKQVWGDFSGWIGGLWDGVKEKWGVFTDWLGRMWDGVKDKWENFKTSAGEIWEGIKTSVSEKWDGLKTNASETWSSLKATIGGGWDAIKTKSGSTWDMVKTYVSNKWGDLKAGAASTWSTLKATVRDSWENIKQNTWATWENIRTTVSSKWDNLKTNASTTWSNISSTIQSKWNSLKSSAPGTWENIRSSIIGKWNSLNTSAGTIWNNIKNTISSRLNDIKNLFNFRWSLPKIKLPHFYVTWSYGGYLGKAAEFLGLPGIPRFSVSWYKEGGIFNQPSIIGVGEAGAEAVVPLERNTGWIDELARKLATALQGVQVAGAGGDIYVYIGNEQIDAYIYRSQDRRNIRSNGR